MNPWETAGCQDTFGQVPQVKTKLMNLSNPGRKRQNVRGCGAEVICAHRKGGCAISRLTLRRDRSNGRE